MYRCVSTTDNTYRSPQSSDVQVL